jgi:hypothetical protein
MNVINTLEEKNLIHYCDINYNSLGLMNITVIPESIVLKDLDAITETLIGYGFLIGLTKDVNAIGLKVVFTMPSINRIW